MALNEEMNKRDMFASQALAGGLKQGDRDICGYDWLLKPEEIAERAYKIADAMMEASDS